MEYNRFDLEQQIMECWNVTEDINTLYEAVEDKAGPLIEDQIVTILIGIKQLYELKFEKLFKIFSSTVANKETP